MVEKDISKESPLLNGQNDTMGQEENFLVLHNDDVHTFDFVIDSLVDICEHNTVQAEQCTFIIHYKGKCDVKKGSFKFLKPLKDCLIERGLNATID
jgi:ATP-dependent Clp protease adaptor protein ClpS